MRLRFWRPEYPDDYRPEKVTQDDGSVRGLTNADMRQGHDSDYAKVSDESLVWIVRHRYGDGAEGEGAKAELSRRHAVAMRRSSTVAAWLATAMIVLAVVQLVVALLN